MSKAIGTELSIIARLRLLPRYLGDKSVPIWRKGFILLLVAYILSPADAIPEIFLPLIGWLDDLGIFGILVAWLYTKMGKYSHQQTEVQLLDESDGNGMAPSSGRLNP